MQGESGADEAAYAHSGDAKETMAAPTSTEASLSTKSNSPKPLFAIEEVFSSDKLKASENETVIERQISPYEKAYTHKGFSYIVWTEGPKSGQVYRVVPAPTEEQTEELPTADAIKSEMVSVLKEVNEFMAENGLTAEDRDSRSEVYKRTDEMLANLYVRMLQLYYGDEKTVGLEYAQLFDLDGRGEEYFDFLQEINRPDENTDDLRSTTGFKPYLEKLAELNGLSVVQAYTLIGTREAQIALKKYFSGNPELTHLPSVYVSDSENPIILTHHTFGNVLTNIVQIGGIASRNYFEARGIKKRYGGEVGGARFSYTPDDVSLWDSPTGKANMDNPEGRREGLEYPLVFGIDREHAQDLDVKEGTLVREKTVRDFIPFERISHVFVPPFKVEEVKKILAEHGIESVNVLPLGTDKSDIWRSGNY